MYHPLSRMSSRDIQEYLLNFECDSEGLKVRESILKSDRNSAAAEVLAVVCAEGLID